jgi:hypothetical protein
MLLPYEAVLYEARVRYVVVPRDGKVSLRIYTMAAIELEWMGTLPEGAILPQEKATFALHEILYNVNVAAETTAIERYVRQIRGYRFNLDDMERMTALFQHVFWRCVRFLFNENFPKGVVKTWLDKIRYFPFTMKQMKRHVNQQLNKAINWYNREAERARGRQYMLQRVKDHQQEIMNRNNEASQFSRICAHISNWETACALDGTSRFVRCYLALYGQPTNPPRQPPVIMCHMTDMELEEREDNNARGEELGAVVPAAVAQDGANAAMLEAMQEDPEDTDVDTTSEKGDTSSSSESSSDSSSDEGDDGFLNKVKAIDGKPRVSATPPEKPDCPKDDKTAEACVLDDTLQALRNTSMADDEHDVLDVTLKPEEAALILTTTPSKPADNPTDPPNALSDIAFTISETPESPETIGYVDEIDPPEFRRELIRNSEDMDDRPNSFYRPPLRSTGAIPKKRNDKPPSPNNGRRSYQRRKEQLPELRSHHRREKKSPAKSLRVKQGSERRDYKEKSGQRSVQRHSHLRPRWQNEVSKTPSPPRRLKLVTKPQARKRPSPTKEFRPADYREEQPMKRYKYHERCNKGLFFDEVRINPEDCPPGSWERFFERTRHRHHDPEMGIIEPVAVTQVYNRVRRFGRRQDRFDLIAVDRNEAHAIIKTISVYGRVLPETSEVVALDGKPKEIFSGQPAVVNDQELGAQDGTITSPVTPEPEEDEELGYVPSGAVDIDQEMKLLAEECDNDPNFTLSLPVMEKTEEEFEAEIRECLRISELDQQAQQMANDESRQPSEPMDIDDQAQARNDTSLEEVLKDDSLETEIKKFIVFNKGQARKEKLD